MKNILLKLNATFILLILLVSARGAWGQTYNIAALNGATTNTCSGSFFDSGGNAGNYSDNEDFTTTFCSGTGQCINFNFTAFRTNDAGDVLTIYDGPNTGSPVIGTYFGNGTLTGNITSTGTCLTFRFVSNGANTRFGWVASISCITKQCPSSTSVAPSAAQSICQGGASNTLTATSTTTGACGTPTTLYQWYSNTTNSNTVAGATLIAGATSSTFTPPTGTIGTLYYFCVAYATNNGCAQTNATQSLATNAVQVTVVANQIANAGENQFLANCATTVTLSGNEITDGGTGTWTVSPAGPTLQAGFTANDHDAVYENLVPGTLYTFTWTSVNGICSNADQMQFNSVGPGCQTYCTPTITPGSTTNGQITNVTINGVGGINNTTAGANVGHQNFYPGTSTTLEAGMTYTLSVTANAYAGMFGPISTCLMAFFDWNGDGDFNDPGEVITLGTVTSTTLPGTILTTNITVPCNAVLGGTVMFRIVNVTGACPASSCPTAGQGQVESYAMIINAPVSPIANAGDDQNVTCSSSAILIASSVPATGFWSLVSGAGTITNPTSLTSTVTGLSNGANVFQWTAQGNCSTDADQVTLNVSGLPNVPVSAGSDVFTCTQGFALDGSDPAPFTGQWVVTSVPGGAPPVIFTPDATAHNAQVSNLINGAYTFQWQVNTASCGLLTDDMIFNFGSLPTPNAGPNQTICPTGAVLNANDFEGAIGTWSVFSGPVGSGFVNVNDPNTTIHSLVVGTYVLHWSVSGGGCLGGSFSPMTITVNPCTNAVTHSASNNQSFTGCSFTYSDNGGPGGNYANNIAQTWTTFCPDDPNDFATITINTAVFAFGDYINIYDSPGPAAPIVASYYNDGGGGGGQVATPALGTTITSSTGCLYIQMNSTPTVNAAGFTATVGCSPTQGVQSQQFVTVNNCGGGGGITVCDSGPITAESGAVTNPPDLGSANSGCLGSQEGSSNTWVYITAESDGWIAFNIDPPGGQDYDYAIWGPYDGGYACPGSTLDDPIRCSWANNGGSGCPSNVGLGIINTVGNAVASSDVSEGGICSATNDGWTYPINATAGEVYVLLFQNYGSNSSTFDFSINDNPNLIPPGESFAVLGCLAPQPLPVELISFVGEHKDRVNKLYWNCASESHNDYFTIERSSDGQNWTVIATVDGAGFSQSLTHYSTIDPYPLMGINYYRLSQTDFDGTKRKYKTIAISTEVEIEHLFSDVYPNPTDNSFYFNYGGKDFNSVIEVNIFNTAGQLMISKTIDTFNSTQSMEIETIDLPTGIYYVSISQSDKREMKKISIIK
jgi:hypothetical protein